MQKDPGELEWEIFYFILYVYNILLYIFMRFTNNVLFKGKGKIKIN